jgi:hypothetical protein
MVRMLNPVRVAVSLFLTVPLTSCLTMAAYQRASEERTFDQFREPDPLDQAWFRAEGFPLSGVLQMTARRTRVLPAGMGFGPEETLTCEGKPIRLIPDTPRNRWLLTERMAWGLKEEGVWRSGPVPEWRWPEPTTLIREAVCGAGGAFRFDGVPDGRYFVMAKISPPAYAVIDPDEDFDIVLKPITVVGGPARSPVNIALSDDSWLSPVVRQR